MYRQCDAGVLGEGSSVTLDVNLDNQFEPIEIIVGLAWRDDGGNYVLQQAEKGRGSTNPSNTGDKKGCSDFDTYELALQWYKR